MENQEVLRVITVTSAEIFLKGRIWSGERKVFLSWMYIMYMCIYVCIIPIIFLFLDKRHNPY